MTGAQTRRGPYTRCPPHGNCGAGHRAQKQPDGGSAGSAERLKLCSSRHRLPPLSVEVAKRVEPRAAKTKTTHEQMNQTI